MKKLVVVAAVILALLQYQLWFGQSGYFAQTRLAKDVQARAERVAVLEQRNRILTAQVLALRSDPAALESRARRDLGMVRKGEVFYLIPNERF